MPSMISIGSAQSGRATTTKMTKYLASMEHTEMLLARYNRVITLSLSSHVTNNFCGMSLNGLQGRCRGSGKTAHNLEFEKHNLRFSP